MNGLYGCILMELHTSLAWMTLLRFSHHASISRLLLTLNASFRSPFFVGSNLDWDSDSTGLCSATIQKMKK